MHFSSELNDLLKSVSRSFYLSLKFLPKVVRAEMSLAYLLARASDSIADSSTVAAAERLLLLGEFDKSLHLTNEDFFNRVATLMVEHKGEQLLLTRLRDCFTLFQAAEPHGKVLIQKVLGHILKGQMLDLQRFPGSLKSAAELEEYTFLVAGCVGEFWSEMLAWKIPNWARLPDQEMIDLGITYGKGLQLVNILRDLPGDLAEGRQYLPGEQSQLIEERNRWAETAKIWLLAGEKYTAHLNHWRTRFTADLPWRLGMETLNLLPPDRLAKAKVNRSKVRAVLFSSAWRSLWGRPANAASASASARI